MTAANVMSGARSTMSPNEEILKSAVRLLRR